MSETESLIHGIHKLRITYVTDFSEQDCIYLLSLVNELWSFICGDCQITGFNKGEIQVLLEHVCTQ